MARSDLEGFTTRVMIFLAIGLVVVVLWVASNALVLTFGGIIMAAAVRSLSDPLARYWHIPSKAAFLGVLLAGVLALVGFGVVLGERLAEQVGQLVKTLPEEIAKARAWMDHSTFGHVLAEVMSGPGKQSLAGVAGFATSTFGGLINVLVILFLGIYLGVDPGLYRRGALLLIPASGRVRAAAAMDAAGDALRHWLAGQLISMVLIGTVSGLGLWLIGTPSALSLGVLAGLLEFIPFVGPILAAVPAILVGFTQGVSGGLWVAVFYLAIHQLEGNVLMPLIQRWAVALPPALAVVAVVVFALLFGPLGVLFATPLMIVAMVFIQKLYFEPVIEDRPAPQAPHSTVDEKLP